MEDVVPSQQDADAANQLDEHASGLVGVVNLADQSKIGTRDARTASVVK